MSTIMDRAEARLHRLSLNQLKALLVLAKSDHAIAGSRATGNKIGVRGKSLGGVYSSLSRQKINNQPLVIPWGKDSSGRGLKWRLNEKLISKTRLKKVVEILLEFEK